MLTCLASKTDILSSVVVYIYNFLYVILTKWPHENQKIKAGYPEKTFTKLNMPQNFDVKSYFNLIWVKIYYTALKLSGNLRGKKI